ncbi:xanthine dehydrogenase family protein molybdopterin-binding subunit [Halococcus agarilyticus]|uniref:xanthine dehydrogenase family protein molybdopterin-binding subunit n=1 Tax=Halococcus agarilyticus TaxID=1232219 RepID=UPI0006782D5B|nr:xanthine dehydrogenase family protein molybdopterin-binding subunit [Halococcus agarilyticus]
MNAAGDGSMGRARPRREDAALLTGDAVFTADLNPSQCASLAFVRSRYGHARIDHIEAAEAATRDGVLGVFTWDDIAASDAPGVLSVETARPGVDVPGHPMLARDRVRYQGQPVAAVVAETPAIASDAAAAVEIVDERLETTVDPIEATTDGAPTLFEGAPDNVAAARELGDAERTDRAFADAATTIEIDLENNRLVPNAMEPRAALARYDPAERRLRVEMTSQTPHGHRSDLATTLGLPEERIRVISPHVGGGFGHKGHHHPGEAMAAWAARELERPIAWTATRTENYAAGAHGRDHRTHAELALDTDGSVRGLRADTYANVGGYGLGSAPILPTGYGRLLSSQYRIPAIHCRVRSVFTNTAPVHSYRGAGRPEAIYVTERLMDVAARELGLDPVELRRRNLLPSDAFPYETPVGAVYDSGDYGRAFDKALAAVDYDDHRGGEANRREDGRYVGVGISCYVESTGSGFESGVVRLDPDGGVTVSAGTHSHGQGHRTTYAQIVADELGVAADDIEVIEGDTDRIPEGTGTFGSRSTIVGGNAVAESARSVATTARRIAADRLEVAADDLVIADGNVRVSGAPSRNVPLAEIVATAHEDGADQSDVGLEETTVYDLERTAYTFGTHAAVVAVDPSTGEIEVERYVAVDDCGPRINPRIVEGQIHGGVAQGIGQALYERTTYDENGNLLTGSLQDYAVPQALDLPEIETDLTVTPSPTNRLGVKGIGEAGTIAAPPAVVNAAVDALSPVGIRHLDMPLTAESVWRAIEENSG